MEPVDIMLDDLARQVAHKAVESARWKARAIAAEETIAKLRCENTDDEGEYAYTDG